MCHFSSSISSPSADGFTLNSPIETVLPPIGIKPTSFQIAAFKAAGLQVLSTALRRKWKENRGWQPLTIYVKSSILNE